MLPRKLALARRGEAGRHCRDTIGLGRPVGLQQTPLVSRLRLSKPSGHNTNRRDNNGRSGCRDHRLERHSPVLRRVPFASSHRQVRQAGGRRPRSLLLLLPALPSVTSISMMSHEWSVEGLISSLLPFVIKRAPRTVQNIGHGTHQSSLHPSVEEPPTTTTTKRATSRSADDSESPPLPLRLC